jgi:rubrerythrin
MSIIYDLPAINRAMQQADRAIQRAMQPAKAVLSNGRYQCRECYCYLGQLSEGAVVGCPNCNAINRVEE